MTVDADDSVTKFTAFFLLDELVLPVKMDTGTGFVAFFEKENSYAELKNGNFVEIAE